MRSRTPATRLTLALLLSIGIGATGAGQSTRRDKPTQPDTPYEYADAHLTLPAHFTAAGPDGIAATDNTPDDNPTTDDGATLGRALFYDTRLSANDTVSCASCHRQRHGFSDPRRFSVGFDRRSTRRHAMSLTNARYYARGRFKAPSLRNVAVRAPYMHDGRFATLSEVIAHYNAEVQPHPFLDMTLLDRRLAVTGGPVRPVRLNLTDTEIDALVAFLHTLTDEAFLTDPKFADPFALAETNR